MAVKMAAYTARLLTAIDIIKKVADIFYKHFNEGLIRHTDTQAN